MQKARSVYFDLDGPILDVSEKYYRVHQAILHDVGCPAGDKDEFWSLKRQRIAPTEILARSCPNLAAPAYSQAWLTRIETPEFLRFDAIVPGAVEVLQALGARYHLRLVTLRRSPSHLRWELETLGLSRFFREILAGHSDAVPGWHVKAELIRGVELPPQQGGAIIGDTEVDILAGKELGLTTIAVTNGIRTRELLEALQPDFIIPDVTGLPRLLDGTAPAEAAYQHHPGD